MHEGRKFKAYSLKEQPGSAAQASQKSRLNVVSSACACRVSVSPVGLAFTECVLVSFEWGGRPLMLHVLREPGTDAATGAFVARQLCGLPLPTPARNLKAAQHEKWLALGRACQCKSGGDSSWISNRSEAQLLMEHDAYKSSNRLRLLLVKASTDNLPEVSCCSTAVRLHLSPHKYGALCVLRTFHCKPRGFWRHFKRQQKSWMGNTSLWSCFTEYHWSPLLVVSQVALEELEKSCKGHEDDLTGLKKALAAAQPACAAEHMEKLQLPAAQQPAAQRAKQPKAPTVSPQPQSTAEPMCHKPEEQLPPQQELQPPSLPSPQKNQQQQGAGAEDSMGSGKKKVPKAGPPAAVPSATGKGKWRPPYAEAILAIPRKLGRKTKQREVSLQPFDPPYLKHQQHANYEHAFVSQPANTYLHLSRDGWT